MPISFSQVPVNSIPLKDYLNRRVSALKLERESWRAHWKDLSEFIEPRRGRYFISDRNKGTKRYNSIINSKATWSLSVAVSGMLAGTMSPVRPWFKLETQDRAMMESQTVKNWLFAVEEVLRTIYNESNFYKAAPAMLKELLLFGTGAMYHVEDFEDVARFYTNTVGSYMIGLNERGEVNTFAREFEWQVGQIAERFGVGNLSVNLKKELDFGNYDKWWPITHIIEPNNDFRPDVPLAQNKPFKSVYYEQGTVHADKEKFLSISGYDEFPVYCPRWSVTAEDVYGSDCPGMVALGDVKQLQVEEKRKAQGIDKMVNPPLHGPGSLRNVPVNSLPGGLTIYDSDTSGNRLDPIYTVNPQLQELRLDMDAVERRIERTFFVDLFLAISNMEGIQPRNQLDLTQRNQERMLQLGPVLESIQQEFLDPLINRTFNQALRADILPPIPEELSGSPLKVSYISTLALAQRAAGIDALDRLSVFTSGLAAAGWPNVIDKFDADQAVDEYGRIVGVTPDIVVPDDVVQEQRAQRQQQMLQQQQLDAGQQVADIAKTANEASQ